MEKTRGGLLVLADALAGVMLVILAALTFIDVLGRNLFSRPLIGSNELTEYSLVAVTFLAYPIIALKRQHVVVDLFDTVFPAWLIHIQKIIGDVLGAVLFAILAYRIWLQALRLQSYGDVTPQLSIPIFYAYFFMSIMAGITVIAFLISAVLRRSTDNQKRPVAGEAI